MTDTKAKPRILQAIDALQAGERGAAVRLIESELDNGPKDGERWRAIARLAAQIGEIDLSLEASRRVARTQPVTLERLLYYCGELTSYGRTAQALEEVGHLSANARQDPAILHFLGTTAAQRGDFTGAEDLYRRALARTPMLPQTWFALAMIKDFTPDDPDLAAMERQRAGFTSADPALVARFLYGLAKAHYDGGDYDRAFALYGEGAALRRSSGGFDAAALTRLTDDIIASFTPDAMRALRPSGERQSNAIFVGGLPRSGTTLVEQILTSHSTVSDGGEINALRAALIPTRDYSMAGARAYEARGSGGGDPWGSLARDYHRMTGMWFGGDGRIVDKTLSQSRLIGFLLHMLPDAPVIWMRRNADDAALSCYRSYFTSGVDWSWSLTDIGHFFREEDRLYAHWTTHFGDRILTVNYEDLTRTPDAWIPRMLDHCELVMEPQVHQPHLTKREVRTASVQQVRAPISAARIGSADAIGDHLQAFHAAYGDGPGADTA